MELGVVSGPGRRAEKVFNQSCEKQRKLRGELELAGCVLSLKEGWGHEMQIESWQPQLLV